MEFKSNKGIYLQIADSLCNQILEGKLSANERVPSVRDLAGELEVNRNTVMRTYSYLEEQHILKNKRGIGFFVTENAEKEIIKKQKEEFFNNEVPSLIEKIQLLKLTSNDLKKIVNEIKKNDSNENI